MDNDRMAIQIAGVTKQYRLGQIGSGTLTRDLQSWWARVRGKEDPNTKIGSKRITGDTLMALNGIDLTIHKGERVGIIGRNGAGKSTLLKLLCRVTAPTSGEIDIYGRITSMLEVGTGFHGEMTGRENIYMNGAILGMKKEEIDRKIEDIIEFSEVREFIDTPVKRYSSGMFVKLAFAVAAHLDSEIMIMDEVLAVGDVTFQKKCLEKMRQVSDSEGRTILYVSHNMNTIRKLCDRCIVLDEGMVFYDGDVETAIGIYSSDAIGKEKMLRHYYFDESERNLYFSSPGFKITELMLNKSCFECGETISVTMKVNSVFELENVRFRFVLTLMQGDKLGTMFSEQGVDFPIGEKEIAFSLDTTHLMPEKYRVHVIALLLDEFEKEHRLDCLLPGFLFEIADVNNQHYPGYWNTQNTGFVRLHDAKIRK